MPIIQEFRYVMPMSVNEYIHSLDYVDIRSKMMQFESAKDGEGVEVVDRYSTTDPETNLPIEVHSQILHIHHKLPSWMKALSTSLRDLKLKQTFYEQYSHDRCYSRTASEFVDDDWLNSKLKLSSESRIVDGTGTDDNIFNLTDQELRKRKIEYVDMTQTFFDEELLNKVQTFQSKDGERGPLGKQWWMGENINFPVCCVCKLIKIECNVFGFSGKVEKAILQEGYYKNNVTFHQLTWTLFDEWSNLSSDEIKTYVEKHRNILEEHRRLSEEGKQDNSESSQHHNYNPLDEEKEDESQHQVSEEEKQDIDSNEENIDIIN